MLLDRVSLAAVKAASTDETRIHLNGIYVEPDGTTVGTDGHMLVTIKPSGLETDEFPAIPGVEATPLAKGVCIPKAAVEAATKAIPKKTSLPILKTALLAVDDKGGKLAATDLDTPTVLSFRSPEGDFSKYQSVIPKQDDVMWRAALNVDLLKTLADIFKVENKDCGSHVVLEFRKGHRAITVKPVDPASRCAAILMPLVLPNGLEQALKEAVEEAA